MKILQIYLQLLRSHDPIYIIFTDKREASTYLGKKIGKIKAGDILVIDIAMIPTLEEQSFVVADVMKNIDQLYVVRHNLDDTSYKHKGK